jgi:hypothetical protein
MARLQILELPEGAGDDRPPFVLVVDECIPQRIALGADSSYGDYWQELADKIGARGVIVTPETVDIPANDTTAYNGIPGGDYTTFAATVGRALGIDTSTAVPDVASWLLTACRELEKSETAREQLRRERDAQGEALERVRQESARIRTTTRTWEPVADLIDAALNGK